MGSVSGIEISARRAIRRLLICYVRRNRGNLRVKSWAAKLASPIVVVLALDFLGRGKRTDCQQRSKIENEDDDEDEDD